MTVWKPGLWGGPQRSVIPHCAPHCEPALPDVGGFCFCEMRCTCLLAAGLDWRETLMSIPRGAPQMAVAAGEAATLGNALQLYGAVRAPHTPTLTAATTLAAAALMPCARAVPPHTRHTELPRAR